MTTKFDPRPLRPSDLEVGMVYYECSSGTNLQGTVVTPVETSTIVIGSDERKQWQWVAKRIDGSEFDCTSTEGFGHYGPRIYREPQYAHWKPETETLEFKVI